MTPHQLLYAALMGLAHYVVLGALYGNPLVDRLYKAAQANAPGVRDWRGQTPRYLALMFAGTMVEALLIAAAAVALRPALTQPGLAGAAQLALLFTGLRVYPRLFNMWIQSTYPGHLLAVEAAFGTVGTFLIVLGMERLTT